MDDTMHDKHSPPPPYTPDGTQNHDNDTSKKPTNPPQLPKTPQPASTPPTPEIPIDNILPLILSFLHSQRYSDPSSPPSATNIALMPSDIPILEAAAPVDPFDGEGEAQEQERNHDDVTSSIPIMLTQNPETHTPEPSATAKSTPNLFATAHPSAPHPPSEPAHAPSQTIQGFPSHETTTLIQFRDRGQTSVFWSGEGVLEGLGRGLRRVLQGEVDVQVCVRDVCVRYVTVWGGFDMRSGRGVVVRASSRPVPY